MIEVVHAVLAGVWLGSVIFSMAVISPALYAMKWTEPERVLVRSRIGKQYTKVGGINLTLLVVFALLEGFLAGFETVLLAEYLLLAILVGLVTVHGAYFGRRLRGLAEAERSAASDEEARPLALRRREVQTSSLRISAATLLVSLAVALLATAP